jgi:hypothetical protein
LTRGTPTSPAIADTAICPILTLDAAKWRRHATDLPASLHYLEITDPDESGPTSNRHNGT